MGNLLAEFQEFLKSNPPAYRSKFIVDFSMDKNNTFNYNIDNIKYLVQSVDLPNIQIDSENNVEIKNFSGVYKGPGNVVIVPENNNFTITFIDTEEPIHEKFFYPWMNEIITAKAKNKYPYTRATINIWLLKNKAKTEDDWAIHYRILGSYPSHIDTPNLKYGEGSDLVRTIGFEFNKILVNIRK